MIDEFGQISFKTGRHHQRLLKYSPKSGNHHTDNDVNLTHELNLQSGTWHKLICNWSLFVRFLLHLSLWRRHHLPCSHAHRHIRFTIGMNKLESPLRVIVLINLKMSEQHELPDLELYEASRSSADYSNNLFYTLPNRYYSRLTPSFACTLIPNSTLIIV